MSKDHRIIHSTHNPEQRAAVKSWEASGYHIIYYRGHGRCEMKRGKSEYIIVDVDGTLYDE